MTARRPVPLEYFLYTGQDGKTKKDMFKIIDSDGQFVQKGYQFDIRNSDLYFACLALNVFRTPIESPRS